MAKHVAKLALIPFAMLIVASSFAATYTHKAGALSGSDFKAGRIIDDTIFFNKDSMNAQQIQDFLNSKVPSCDHWNSYKGTIYGIYNQAPYICLKEYNENPTTHENNLGRLNSDGSAYQVSGGKSAAQIIWDVAQTYGINPQVLITTLQKETGIVTDTWAAPWQYSRAMGYACPDTAACDTSYYGFYNQVNSAAKQLRKYVTYPDSYNFKAGVTRNILYSPAKNADGSYKCGSSSVYIETQGTAALYNYTPYQPNAAALAGMNDNTAGGTADCGAYGNRNFFWYFNRWFGSSRDDNGYMIVIPDDGSLTQYLVYNKIKQRITSPSIKVAWGIQDIQPMQISSSYLNTFNSGPDLDILFKIRGNDNLYVADSGNKFSIPNSSLIDQWSLGGKAISTVPPTLGSIPQDKGWISQTLKPYSSNDYYMIDGINESAKTILRKYQSETLMYAIESRSVKVTEISDELFGLVNKDVRPSVTSTKFAYGGNEYQVYSRQRSLESYPIAQLYPGSAVTVSQSTIERFTLTDTAMSPFVQDPSQSAVYIVQNGQKHHVTDPYVLTEWLGSKKVIKTNADYNAYIPTNSGTLANTIVKSTDNISKYIIMQGSKAKVPSQLSNAYTPRSSEFIASDILLSTLTSSGQQFGRIIRNSGNKKMYVLDDSGTIHYIPSTPLALMWGANSAPVLELPDSVVLSFIESVFAKGYVSDGTNNYMLIGGKLSYIPPSTQWRLTNPLVFNDNTLANIEKTGDLGNSFYFGNTYYAIIGGKTYLTTDPAIASLWNITYSNPDYASLVEYLAPPKYMLSAYFSYLNTVYAVDKSRIYKISDLKLLKNLNLPLPIVPIDLSYLNNYSAQDWRSPIIKANSGLWYVIDDGKLRLLPNDTIINSWTQNKTYQAIVASVDFLKFFTRGSNLERVIKSNSSPNVYLPVGDSRYWVSSPLTYAKLYAPYATVSQVLIDCFSESSIIY